ncbi:MAG: T9SS type A sorting domain-containing protein [Calditrichae bacterium]|nr:T9SS type A sorting domain-containing protein [Calditrichia bacterium]
MNGFHSFRYFNQSGQHRHYSFSVLSLLSFLFILLFINPAFSQWQKISSIDAGISGRVTCNGNALIYHGYNNGAILFESDNNGSSWNDYSESIPDNFSDVYSFNDSLYAVWLDGIFISSDNGKSWHMKATVTFDGGGALLGLTSDGSSLYAWSNRKAIYKSADHGENWDEIIVNDDREILMVDFAAVGDRYAAVFAGVGVLISDDAGLTWEENNNPIAITGVDADNGNLLGLTYSGVYRMNSGSDEWVISSSGLPDNGLYKIAKQIIRKNNVLYLLYYDLFAGTSHLCKSADQGYNWTAMDLTGLPAKNSASLSGYPYLITANSTHLFYYNYTTNDSLNTGVYALSIPATDIAENNPAYLPAKVSLEQNYPNPFNPSTTISFYLASAEYVSLNVYNLKGQKITELINQSMMPGHYTLAFTSTNFPSVISSGIYIYRLQAGNIVLTKKMSLIK